MAEAGAEAEAGADAPAPLKLRRTGGRTRGWKSHIGYHIRYCVKSSFIIEYRIGYYISDTVSDM